MSRREGQDELVNALRGLLATLHEEQSQTAAASESGTRGSARGLTFGAFFRAFEELPRVRGERVRWAASLGLEGELARLLARGSVFDGLRSLRLLRGPALDEHVAEVCRGFAAVLPGLLRSGLQRLQAGAEGGSGESEVHSLINSKFVMDGAYVGRFATLDDFYRGPEALIGVPNPKVLEGMHKEHTARGNALRHFKTSNYNLTSWPALEWEFVVDPRPGGGYPHCPRDRRAWRAGNEWLGAHGREAVGVDELIGREDVALRMRVAGLRRDEVIALRLYTGPMFVLYNASLRGFPAWDVECLRDNAGLGPANKYETTIFVIASGIVKLSKVTDVPADRRLYRGLGGMVLPDQFWRSSEECQVTLAIRDSQARGGGAVAALLRRVRRAHSAVMGSNHLLTTQVLDLTDMLPEPEIVQPQQLDSGSALQAARKKYAAAWVSSLREPRMVSDPRHEGGVLRLVLALQLPKAALVDGETAGPGLCGALVAAVQAASGCEEVTVESIADKPKGFKGGIEFGLLSTTTAKETAFQYSGVDKNRGTVFEIQAGRVDVGASIHFLSQYPGEAEFLMQPLCCLEVMGEPRVDRTPKGEVVVVPMRVNVNLKAQTVEDLIQRRKYLHSSMAKNLREDLLYLTTAKAEEFEALIRRRRLGHLEVYGMPHDKEEDKKDSSSDSEAGGEAAIMSADVVEFRGGLREVIGAPYIAARSGQVYFQVEVLPGEGQEEIVTSSGQVDDEGSSDSDNGGGQGGPVLLVSWLGSAFAEKHEGRKSSRKNGIWCLTSDGRVMHSGHTGRARILRGGFGRPGKLMGMAVDLDKGRILACAADSPVNPANPSLEAAAGPGSSDDKRAGGNAGVSAHWVEAVSSGVTLSRTVGGGLLPMIMGGGGARVRLNVGIDTSRPLLLAPPSSEFVPLAQAKGLNSLWCNEGAKADVPSVLDSLRASSESLLAEFDQVRLGHEAFNAEAFNEDQAYKTWLNEMLDTKVGVSHKQSALIMLLKEGADPGRLMDCGKWPAVDFRDGVSASAPVKGMAWTDLLARGRLVVHLKQISLPLKLPPCIIGLVWESVLGGGGAPLIHVGKDLRLPLRDFVPTIRVKSSKIHTREFEMALLGLILASVARYKATGGVDLELSSLEAEPEADDQSESGSDSESDFGGKGADSLNEPHDEAARHICPRWVTDADLRGGEYSGERLYQLANAVASAAREGPLTTLNELLISHLEDSNFSDCVTRKAESNQNLGNQRYFESITGKLEGPIEFRFALARAAAYGWRSMDLSKNWLDAASIRWIAEGLHDLTTLTSLNLSQNKLGEDAARHLAEAMSKLQALESLDLGHTSLRPGDAVVILSAAVRLPVLRAIDLSNNRTQSKNKKELEAWAEAGCLSGSLARLTGLTRLDLSRNGIAGKGAVAIIHALSSLQQLRYLDIGHNKLGATAAASALVQSLCVLTSLEHLRLESSSLGPENVATLSAGLSLLVGLNELNLSRNNVGEGGKILAGVALRHLTSLTTLELSDCSINQPAVLELACILVLLTKLCRLSLNGNTLGSEGSVALAHSLAGMANLCNVNLRDSKGIVNPGGALLFLEHLLPGMKSVHIHSGMAEGSSWSQEKAEILISPIPGGVLGPEGARWLSKVLIAGNGSRLCTLNLTSNSLGDEGGSSLAAALPLLPILESLCLGSNNLGDRGASAIASTITGLSALKVLKLERNSLNSAGACSLALALPALSALADLDVSTNDLKNEGATALVAGLKDLTRLHTLDISSNKLDSAGWSAVVDGVAGLPSLSCLGSMAEYGKVQRGELNAVNWSLHLPAEMLAGAARLFHRSASTLTVIDLEPLKLGPEHVTALSEVLPLLTALTKLKLGEKALGPQGGRALGAGLFFQTKLKILELGEADMRAEGAMGLAAGLAAGPRDLVRLNLGGNAMSAEGGTALGTALFGLSCLTYLNLESNQLGAEGAQALSEAFRTLSALLTLDLTRNSLGPRGGMALSSALESLRLLECLRLGDNGLGSVAWEAAMGALERAESSHGVAAGSASAMPGEMQNGLTSLNGLRCMARLRTGDLTRLQLLGEIEYNSRKAPEVVAPLARLLPRSASRLTELDLSKVTIDPDEEAPPLAAALSSLTALSELRLESCQLGPRGAGAVVAAAAHLSSLLVLDLGDNRLGSEGAVALSSSLTSMTRLRSLMARSNGLGAEGAASVCKAMVALTQMTLLDLCDNHMGEGAGEALGRGLAGMAELQKLFLAENRLGPAGGLAVAAAISGRSSLQALVLIHNELGQEVEQQVRAEWGLRIGGWREEEELGLHLLKSDELALSESS